MLSLLITYYLLSVSSAFGTEQIFKMTVPDPSYLLSNSDSDSTVQSHIVTRIGLSEGIKIPCGK